MRITRAMAQKLVNEMRPLVNEILRLSSIRPRKYAARRLEIVS